MYYFISLLAGTLISVMVAANGGLTELYGVYGATVIIHVAGLILISFLVLLRRENPFSARHAWFLYLGGAIGVLTTVFNNFAFVRISVSALLALGLLGQSAAGLAIDQFGLFGMKRYPFNRRKFFGILIIIGGIGVMMDNMETAAIIVSFAAGVTVVTSRSLNAKLSEFTGVQVSTFYNYLIGLIVSVPVFVFLGGGVPIRAGFAVSREIFIYFGGILGVCVVVMSNITALKISAFYLTLLMFAGQVFSGVLIDAVISGAFSSRILLGGVLVTLGLCVNLLADDRRSGR